MLHSRSLLFISFVYSSVNVGEGNGTPLQYSRLENPIDRGAWWAAVHGVAKSRTRLSNFTFTLHFHALEKEMATHSSILALRIPGTGEPGGLLSVGSHRVGQNWSDLAAVNYHNITVLNMSSKDNKPLFRQLRIGIQLIFGHKRLKYYHYLIKYWFCIFNRRQGK